ncbi:MAG: hypothetical protein MUE66_01425 [Acidimicrobiia bacterium]|jgi:hypothetical protein|nr:hypothetical protein [Acidimicrobiia bacterium]MCU0934653.1 hypothetical protein [Gammaproteobacteria bacterium]
MSGPTAADGALGDRLVEWMGEERPALDRLMAEEGSRALHEEFILAEGGVLPDRAQRLERARSASARAWLRHLAAAVEACWADAPAGLGKEVAAWLPAHAERLEALVIDEEARSEQRGRAADPADDRREVELVAQARLFAEGLGAVARPGGDDGPAFARRLVAWQREQPERRRALIDEAIARSGGELSGAEEAAPLWERAPEQARAREAALLWAHVRFLAEATGACLTAAGPPDPSV